MSGAPFWLVVLGLGLGTFLIRFSFLGGLGARRLPPWALRHLRYTGPAVLPGLVAPLALWPAATGGQTDPWRLGAALLAVAAGLWTRSVLWSLGAGAAALALGALLG